MQQELEGAAMIEVNGLKACDACRKAMRDLSAAGRKVRLRDLRDAPPSEGELSAWYAHLGEGLLNRRSTTWRTLSEVEREGDPVALMALHPTLMKRPVLTREGTPPLLGWTEGTRAALGL
jgi:arsenate reductase